MNARKAFRQHTHKRHAAPAPAHTTPAHSDLLRTACAPTSTLSFCAYVLRVVYGKIAIAFAKFEFGSSACVSAAGPTFAFAPDPATSFFLWCGSCGPFPGCLLAFCLPTRRGLLAFLAQTAIRVPNFQAGKFGLEVPDFRTGGIPLAHGWERRPCCESTNPYYS
jgi:hypothetical protein